MQLISRFWRWLDRNLSHGYYQDMEHYLSQSQDIFELEARIRRWEAQQSRNGNFYLS